MTESEIAELIRSNMAEEFYSKPGAVLYSPASSLRPGKIFIMGLNPGGNPVHIPNPMIDVNAPDQSVYTHDCWQPDCEGPKHCSHVDANGKVQEKYLVKHQRNMIALADTLGIMPSEIFSANAIFARSTSKDELRAQTGLGMWEWWEICWSVHQHFLAIVRPKIIVTLGYGENSSAFGLLRSKAGSPAKSFLIENGPRSGPNFEARFDLGESDDLNTRVIGIPHPSWYGPGEVLSKELSGLVREI